MWRRLTNTCCHRGPHQAQHGPKENRQRPAVNALFRSAAIAYGPGVIGVVLTGALDDGAAGLWEIKQRGGKTIVQDPTDALFPDMPRNALEQVPIDYVGPVQGLASTVERSSRPASPLSRQKRGKDEGYSPHGFDLPGMPRPDH